MKTVWLTVLMLLCATAGGSARCRATPTDGCISNRQATSLAVSIVYAMCNGSVVLAADSIASAAVSGCGDAVAAGISVSVAAMGSGDLQEAVYAAFSASLTSTTAENKAAAVAEAMALAIASAPPSALGPGALVAALADAVQRVGQTSGCRAAKLLASSIGQTFADSDATGELMPMFVAALAPPAPTDSVAAPTDSVAAPTDSVATDSAAPTSGYCRGLDKAAKQAPAKGKRGRYSNRAGGKGAGCVKRPLFSKGVDRMRLASSVAVTIVQAACPTGNASITAIAIALASTNDASTTATAMAGLLDSGVDITSAVTAVFLQAAGARRTDTVKALGAAIVASTPEDQAKLLRILGAAVEDVARELGCDQARDQLLTLDAAGLGGQQLQQVCFLVDTCPSICPSPARRA